ncbi:hypothetical protein Csa_018964 [Cucumis sativus]|uniref:Uncharacterized protein n=1 Tax=Cucumis sativus TaxID=3659 RepID=A0A0A0KFK9_CUCSA|nr:hypothetical protein Csa_018964 [Cucumis sativus]
MTETEVGVDGDRCWRVVSVEIDGVWREMYNGNGGGAHLDGIIVATAIDGACYGFSQGPITVIGTIRLQPIPLLQHYYESLPLSTIGDEMR